MGYRGGWLARYHATETGKPRYDGMVGSAVAGWLWKRGESGGSAAVVAHRRRRDIVHMAREALLGRTNARDAVKQAGSLCLTFFPSFASPPPTSAETWPCNTQKTSCSCPDQRAEAACYMQGRRRRRAVPAARGQISLFSKAFPLFWSSPA